MAGMAITELNGQWQAWVDYLKESGNETLALNLVEAGVLTRDNIMDRGWTNRSKVRWSNETKNWIYAGTLMNYETYKTHKKEETVMATLNTDKYTLSTQANRALGGWRGSISLYNGATGEEIPVWESEVQETEEDALNEAKALLEDAMVKVFALTTQ